MKHFTYVVGDIHGHAVLLKALIDTIKKTFTKHDKIVFLGDYIDRGENSKGVIELLVNLKNNYPHQIICLKGNHEQWFLDTYYDYSKISWLISMEGMSTIRSYSKEAVKLIQEAIKHLGAELLFLKDKNKRPKLPYHYFFNTVPESHIHFLKTLELFYEDESLICAHAGLDVDGPPLEYQTEDDLLWTHTKSMLVEWKGPKTLVVGHTNTEKILSGQKGQPIITQHSVFLDTGSPKSNVLTSVRFPDRKILQVKFP